MVAKLIVTADTNLLEPMDRVEAGAGGSSAQEHHRFLLTFQEIQQLSEEMLLSLLLGAGFFNLTDAFWKSDYVMMDVELIFACLCFVSVLALAGVLCYL